MNCIRGRWGSLCRKELIALMVAYAVWRTRVTPHVQLTGFAQKLLSACGANDSMREPLRWGKIGGSPTASCCLLHLYKCWFLHSECCKKSLAVQFVCTGCLSKRAFRKKYTHSIVPKAFFLSNVPVVSEVGVPLGTRSVFTTCDLKFVVYRTQGDAKSFISLKIDRWEHAEPCFPGKSESGSFVLPIACLLTFDVMTLNFPLTFPRAKVCRSKPPPE